MVCYDEWHQVRLVYTSPDDVYLYIDDNKDCGQLLEENETITYKDIEVTAFVIIDCHIFMVLHKKDDQIQNNFHLLLLSGGVHFRNLPLQRNNR